MTSVLNQFFEFLKDWQTLLSALIALGAAWWTVSTLKLQIAGEAGRYQESLLRKKLSARAQMPDALSALCQFSEQCMKALDGRNDELPPRAGAAIDVLKSAIQFIDDQAASKVFELVSFYQVHSARIYRD